MQTGQVINEIPRAYVTEEGIYPKIEGQYQVQGVSVTPGEYKIGALQILTGTNPVIVRAITGTTTVGQSYQYIVRQSPFEEDNGSVVLEAEDFTAQIGRSDRGWLTQTVLSGYVGSGYLNTMLDTGWLFTTTYTTTSPEVRYTINITTTGTYYLWLRGYASDGGGDSVYVGLDGQLGTAVTGFAPRKWDWANETTPSGTPVMLQITEPGLHTLQVWQREDGVRLDRILLTIDDTYTPSGSGP